MKFIKEKYRPYLQSRVFVLSALLGFVLLIASVVINFYTGVYAAGKASNAVTDIILDNIPVFNVDDIFVYGPFLMWLFVAALLLKEPKTIPFTLKSIALFVLIRSVFITLTHIGPFPDQMQITDGLTIIRKFTFGGDLFFSAHTGLPFLMALIFWQHKKLRYFFSFCAVLFAVVVLMGHLHYSIDVMAAFFITYSIYHICLTFFKKDREVFFNGL